VRIQTALIVLLLVAWMPSRSALALEVAAEGGRRAPRETRPALTDAQREQMWSEIHANRASLRAAEILPDLKQRAMSFVAPPSLGPPLASVAGYTDPGFFAISGFVDHDPAYPDQLEDYDCGLRTYDLADGYGHAGQRVGAIHEFFNRRKLTLDLVRKTQAVKKLPKLTPNLDQLMQAGQDSDEKGGRVEEGSTTSRLPTARTYWAAKK
jgi:hypothetical protein